MFPNNIAFFLAVLNNIIKVNKTPSKVSGLIYFEIVANIIISNKKVHRKVQGMPQSQTTANPQH